MRLTHYIVLQGCGGIRMSPLNVVTSVVLHASNPGPRNIRPKARSGSGQKLGLKVKNARSRSGQKRPGGHGG
jgi:hypothetical protein